MTVADGVNIAKGLIGALYPRWDHAQAVGRRAQELCEHSGLPERVVVAAWLHDIGYSPEIAAQGFHPLDGARFLARVGAPKEVVRLVAWHTGAGFEAEERGLLPELREFAQPDPEELDALTMIDLATGPEGTPVLDVNRIAEILSRYEEWHPVHKAVTRSALPLLDASRRAKWRLRLPEDWPLSC